MPAVKRETNFELLRIIAMLMVVSLHYLYYAGLPPSLTGSVNADSCCALAIESLSIVAVNIFVLISGYFLALSPFTPRRFFGRLILLVCQVLFYSALIPPILKLLGQPIIADTEGIYGVLNYIFPVSTEHYWFITSFVLMYLFSPLLNAALEKIEKKQLEKIILALLIYFCFIKSLVPVMLNMDNFGYDFGWFLVLYLSGAYIRKYGLTFMEKKGRALLLYLLCAAGVFGLKLGIYQLNAQSGLLKYYYDVPFHYNFILVYLAAIGLFMAFMQLKIKEGRLAKGIRQVAPLSLGVYLLHMHIDIRDMWYTWTRPLFGGLDGLGVFGLFLDLAATVLLIYCAGIGVDALRRIIFKVVSRKT